MISLKAPRRKKNHNAYPISGREDAIMDATTSEIGAALLQKTMETEGIKRSKTTERYLPTRRSSI
jgi:hypothetical protein